MTIFRVTHKMSAVTCYYTHARSAAEAIERVTLALGDLEGASAWTAEEAEPDFVLAKHGVFDHSGARIKTLDA